MPKVSRDAWRTRMLGSKGMSSKKAEFQGIVGEIFLDRE